MENMSNSAMQIKNASEKGVFSSVTQMCLLHQDGTRSLCTGTLHTPDSQERWGGGDH